MHHSSATMMQLFYGSGRKLSALPIVLFAVGWGLYLVGFVKRMIKPSLLFPRWGNYPAMVAIGVGPLLVFTAILQACLGGTASAAMGSLTAISAVVFLVSLGNSSITSAETLYQYNNTLLAYNSTSENWARFYLSCTLAGSVLCCIGVTFFLLLWSCYKDAPQHSKRAPVNFGSTDAQRGFKLKFLFPGYARKLAVPCIFLAFMGWCVLVGGHHHRINSVPQEGRYVDDMLIFDLGQWGACVLTPLLLLFGLLHAGASGLASAVMAVVNSVLNGIVLTSIGYYMIHDVGQWLQDECKTKCDYSIPQNAAALCELVGSFLFCFFWGSVVALWPFYTKCLDNKEDYRLVLPMSGRSNRGRANSQDYQDMDDDEQPIQL